MSFKDKFMDKMMSFASKVSANIYISAIKDAFVENMPLLIAGSFATLGSSVLCSTTSGLAQFSGFEFLADFTSLFSTINYACINLLAFYICFLIGAAIGRKKGYKETFSGMLALACYVVLIPTSLTTEVDGVSVTVNNVIANTSTNSQGLFLAMFVGIGSILIFDKLMQVKKFRIKMPDAVPPSVATSFSSLIPTVLTLFVISLISYIFVKIFNMNISTAIVTALQTPLLSVMQHPLGILVIIFVTQIFWVLGLHGANITAAVREPLMILALTTNLELFNAGQSPTMIVAKPFWSMFCTIGGSGCTLGLLIAIYIASKREDYRAIAKLSTAPALFTINEPLIFGLPLVLNPMMMIPFVLAPLVSAGIGYFATYIGFAGATVVDVPWTTPAFLNSYLATGGNIGAVITQLICLIVCVLIYLPFVKMANKEVTQEVNG